jgi:hypothetical protein
VTYDEIADAIYLLRRRAKQRNPDDALWGLIFEAEALLRGEFTLRTRERIEAELEKALQAK